jgi:ankyrin repeat protein
MHAKTEDISNTTNVDNKWQHFFMICQRCQLQFSQFEVPPWTSKKSLVPRMYAASSGNAAIIRMLLSARAHLNDTNERGVARWDVMG